MTASLRLQFLKFFVDGVLVVLVAGPQSLLACFSGGLALRPLGRHDISLDVIR